MKIAQLAPNVERVPPNTYGGTELIVHLLTESLIKQGHEVTLFASGDSITKARLISVTEISLRANSEIATRQWQAFDLQTLLKLKEMQNEFDIVHNHMGYQALPYLDQLSCAVVSTNHNPIKPYNLPIYKKFSHLPFIAISHAFKRFNYGEELNYVSVVYNGIDVEQYSINNNVSRSYLLFIGRVGADKGTAAAIKIAQALKLPLKIAGKVDQSDQLYFELEVKPHLGQNIQYIGEVNHQAKVELYQKAIAVVYPIAFEEPFGLVMAEALACGIPVMALDRGSVSEVLSDKETAVIAKTPEELIARFPEIKQIKAELCRNRANELFSKEQMVTNYEKVYKNLLNLTQQKHGRQYAST